MLPHPVIRGESPHGLPRASVDWLNATFPAPQLGFEGLVAALATAAGGVRLRARQVGGILGFGRRDLLTAATPSGTRLLGSVCRGGSAQAGVWMLQITGEGCGLVEDWRAVESLLRRVHARLSRCDVRVDFLCGEVTVDDAVAMRERGEFDVRGRRPSSQVAGDWLEGKGGRTFYVGKPQNGKVLRVYEKGKQQGHPDSRWVRVEVQFGNRGRTIPLDVLTDPDPYFAGAYPALGRLLPVAGRAIATRKRVAVEALAHKLAHLRRSYGAALNQALATADVDEEELLDVLRAPGQVVCAGGTQTGQLRWADVRAELQRHFRPHAEQTTDPTLATRSPNGKENT